MKKNKESILNYNLRNLKQWLIDNGEREYRADQIMSWIFQQGILEFEKMTNLSKTLRERLMKNFYILDTVIERRLDSSDGTFKLLLKLMDENCIEAVFIPQDDRHSICVSSQIGCALGCRFCATGNMGIVRNLSASEILSQVLIVRKAAKREDFGQVVFMGMGEPLLNSGNVMQAVESMTASWGFGWSPRRITISTAGIIPEIQRLGAANPGIKLAVSLNAADEKTRSRIMPINKKYPLQKLLSALREYPLQSRKHCITIEYTMLKGMNDSKDDARKLVKLLERKRNKINLIAFNSIEGFRFKPSEENQILIFQKILSSAGYIVRIRQSKGGDIGAACGQLAGKISDAS